MSGDHWRHGCPKDRSVKLPHGQPVPTRSMIACASRARFETQRSLPNESCASRNKPCGNAIRHPIGDPSDHHATGATFRRKHRTSSSAYTRQGGGYAQAAARQRGSIVYALRSWPTGLPQRTGSRCFCCFYSKLSAATSPSPQKSCSSSGAAQKRTADNSGQRR